jgi:hypothetical protein
VKRTLEQKGRQKYEKYQLMPKPRFLDFGTHVEYADDQAYQGQKYRIGQMGYPFADNRHGAGQQ